ncbi:EcsC protein family protein [Catalinimonas alkaloidigena]|uniref:EcsC protein family protein n=1 Tax=Catalinimonas alkaloidigena TaxID=1075417 RepID=A0A1G9II50_9BACT|nr:EcsC family protein [Catalinimonas alkaloidigena]SDL24860.1 EcsC protein family protein [Catalinimonas alkaloidigena]
MNFARPSSYEAQALQEMQAWQQRIYERPTFTHQVAQKVQDKLNGLMPDRVTDAITAAVKQMIRAVLFGAELTNPAPLRQATLERREHAVERRIDFYRKTAAAEGGITGAGGFLLGLADFPMLLGLKLKMLFELAALYGYDVSDYRERLYLLYLMQLAFSTADRRQAVYEQMIQWEARKLALPDDIHQYDWRTFQQEYRDYLDVAKFAQLLPFIGAPVGVIVNYRLVTKLGNTAMNAYRLRWYERRALAPTAVSLLK